MGKILANILTLPSPLNLPANLPKQKLTSDWLIMSQIFEHAQLNNNKPKRAMAFECLRKTVPVGGKNDPVCPNTILLLKDKPLTFGRVISTETNVRLLSKQTPLMVSRKHATVAYSAGEWTIVDHESADYERENNSNKTLISGSKAFFISLVNVFLGLWKKLSLNGVFINGRKIPVNSPEPLSIGDKITIGVAVNSGHPEFEYVLESMSKPKKRQAEPSTASEAISNKQRKVLSESDRSNVHRETPSCSHDEKIKAAEQKIKILNNNLEEKEKVYEKVLEELKRKESVMESELLRQKASLENEKEDLERSLKELLEKSPKEKEEMLSEELETQKELLIKEKHKVEEKLQNELNQKLELKDKELEEKLLAQKADLEKVIAEKEAQQKELQQELSIHKSATEKLKDLEENEKRLVTSVQELQSLMEKKDRELLKQMEVTKKAEEEARKSVVEEMEDEFSCIVCQELFIRATTLTCSHSFCEYCLQSWLRKRNTCPICRCAVQSQPVRSIVLDNAIAKMVDSMDVASKERRRAVMEERAEKSRELAQSSGSQRTPIVLNEEPERRHVRVNNEVRLGWLSTTVYTHPLTCGQSIITRGFSLCDAVAFLRGFVQRGYYFLDPVYSVPYVGFDSVWSGSLDPACAVPYVEFDSLWSGSLDLVCAVPCVGFDSLWSWSLDPVYSVPYVVFDSVWSGSLDPACAVPYVGFDSLWSGSLDPACAVPYVEFDSLWSGSLDLVCAVPCVGFDSLWSWSLDPVYSVPYVVFDSVWSGSLDPACAVPYVGFDSLWIGFLDPVYSVPYVVFDSVWSGSLDPACAVPYVGFDSLSNASLDPACSVPCAGFDCVEWVPGSSLCCPYCQVDVWVEPRRIHNSYLRGNNSRHNEVYERVTHYHDYRNQYSHRPPAYGNRYTGLCFHCDVRTIIRQRHTLVYEAVRLLKERIDVIHSALAPETASLVNKHAPIANHRLCLGRTENVKMDILKCP
ncbi:predicted protein [Nematostella vectensis]|uniref:E3 ubiquitin-protein ligase CHFR n=1 Tax=Nematostella vectensis TaxID=45351 RepID=A7RIZ5_NEMVE|nr:predicted protein [Nematostella vectensis]|eukprot:XP_001640657.1 predicted protein [Nematostella vectensis]